MKFIFIFKTNINNKMPIFILAFFILSLIQNVVGGDHEKLLYDRLQHGYNKLARPVRNESAPVIVTLGMDLQQIIDVDEKSQTITTNVWIRMTWTDVYFSWDPSEYGNIKEVRLPIDTIWKPDVLLYNSVEQRFDTMWPVNAIINHNGNVTWIPPAITRSSCRISITWFPFDEQECYMKFGSWSYSSFFTNIFNKSVSLDPYTPNGEWILLKAESRRNLRLYDCCPDEPYIDVTFSFHIRRRTLYYSFNLVIPSVLISSLALLSFTLPPDCGEKLNLCLFFYLVILISVTVITVTGVTILVSLSIFMVMVAETMPQTADSLPLIAVYFTAVMFEVGASVVCTVIVLNFHFRNADAYYPMSKLQRKILLRWLPWILCMRRPPRFKIPHSYGRRTTFKREPTLKLNNNQSQQKTSESLNPLDRVEIDSRLLSHPQFYGKSNGSATKDSKETLFTENLHLENCPVVVSKRERKLNKWKETLGERYFLFTRTDPNRVATLSTQLISPPGGAYHENFEPFTFNKSTASPLQTPEMSGPSPEKTCPKCFSTEQFREIIGELRILTAKTHKEEIFNEIRSEWMFAAMVVDRICFISFTFFLITCTGTIVWNAPHIIA